MTLDGIRRALDEAATTDTPSFARRARNELAKAVLAEAMVPGAVSPPGHVLRLDELERRLGPQLAAHLAAVYAGDAGWTSHAIDALQPLDALARA